MLLIHEKTNLHFALFLEMNEMKKDRFIIEGFHKDQLDSFPVFEDYPSHLHIDLLPRAQGFHFYLVQ